MKRGKFNFKNSRAYEQHCCHSKIKRTQGVDFEMELLQLWLKQSLSSFELAVETLCFSKSSGQKGTFLVLEKVKSFSLDSLPRCQLGFFQSRLFQAWSHSVEADQKACLTKTITDPSDQENDCEIFSKKISVESSVKTKRQKTRKRFAKGNATSLAALCKHSYSRICTLACQNLSGPVQLSWLLSHRFFESQLQTITFQAH